MIRLLSIILFILILPFNANASSTRKIDADSLTSSDHTKTWTLPASSGTLSIGGGTSIQETPSGSINGSNQTFTLLHTPISGTLHLYLDGIFEIPTTHYTISTATISMIVAPAYGQTLYASYTY